MKSEIRVLLLLVVIVPYCAFSQEKQWVETQGLASMAEMSQQQARTAALNQARAEAVRLVAGVKVQAESFRVQSETTAGKKAAVLQDFFASVNRDAAYGHVVAEEILSEAPIPFTTPTSKTPQVYYQVKIRAQVMVEKGEADKSFKLEVKTNKEVYQENESMTIDLRATQDCFVYIFNLLANDSLVVLFPNVYFQDNRLKADMPLHLPPEGIAFQVNLLPGFERAQELIYVVVTKQEFDFAPAWRDESSGFRTTATRSFAALELPRWLVNIPLNQRTDRVVAYEVYRRGIE